MANRRLQMTTNVQNPNQGPVFLDEPSTTNDNPLARSKSGSRASWRTVDYNLDKYNQRIAPSGSVCVCKTLCSKGSCKTWIIHDCHTLLSSQSNKLVQCGQSWLLMRSTSSQPLLTKQHNMTCFTPQLQLQIIGN